MLHCHGFYLSQFYPKASKFHLTIPAPEEYEISFCIKPAEVAGAVESGLHLALLDIWILDESSSSLLWSPNVAPCHTDSTDTDLTYRACRYWLQVCVKQPDEISRERSSYCYRSSKN